MYSLLASRHYAQLEISKFKFQRQYFSQVQLFEINSILIGYFHIYKQLIWEFQYL